MSFEETQIELLDQLRERVLDGSVDVSDARAEFSKIRARLLEDRPGLDRAYTNPDTAGASASTSREVLFTIITDFERELNDELNAKSPGLFYRGYSIRPVLETNGKWKVLFTRKEGEGPPGSMAGKTRLDTLALAKAQIDAALDRVVATE